jgi:hypothetical protein
MKNIKTILTAIIVVIFLISCSNSKQDLIIGKWKMDFSRYDKEKSKLTEDQLHEYNKLMALFESTTLEFFKDKTFELLTIKDGEKITKSGKYQFLNDGKYLELTTHADNGPEKVQQDEIIEITKETMKIIMKSDTILYKKVKE